MNKFIICFIIFLNVQNTSIANELMKIGEDIFLNKEQCVNCHILNASDGGNNKLTKDHVINIVSNGYGVMPAYKNILTKNEIEAVATYIAIEGKNWKNKLSSFVQ